MGIRGRRRGSFTLLFFFIVVFKSWVFIDLSVERAKIAFERIPPFLHSIYPVYVSFVYRLFENV